MSRWIEADALMDSFAELTVDLWLDSVEEAEIASLIGNAPSIDIVRCKECKHRPIKKDANGENYGFNLIEPNDGDERCPCLVSDGWYSWMPKDDFYCGYGERKE